MDALEQHLTPGELSAAWDQSDTKIRRMFQDEPGVLRIGCPIATDRIANAFGSEVLR